MLVLMVSILLVNIRILQLRQRMDKTLKTITEIQEQRIENLERLLGLRPAVQTPQETIQ